MLDRHELAFRIWILEFFFRSPTTLSARGPRQGAAQEEEELENNQPNR